MIAEKKGVTMQHKPNIIKVAVEAAGGRSKVAKAFGVSNFSITHWQTTNRMPPQHIRKLCEMGGIITPDQLLAYIEACAAERAVA